jgi:hypothetical protein
MLTEKKLTKSELNKREEIIMKMKKNKRSLVNKYGKDAEAVMYGRATNMAKKQTEDMNTNRLNELIKNVLSNPKKADLNKDGKLSDYEKTRGTAIEKSMEKNLDEKVVKGQDGKKYKKHDVSKLEEMDPVSWDLKNGIAAQLVPDKVGHSSDGDITDDPSDGYDSSHKDTIKETLDDDVWMKVDALKNNLRGEELIDVIVRAMSTDDANLYIDAIMRDYDISLEDARDDYYKLGGVYGDKRINEGHKGKVDYEGKMAKIQLAHLAKYSVHLFKMLNNEDQLESWIQAKLTKATDYISSVKHYLEGEALLSSPPVMNENESIKDIEGKSLDVGDVVRLSDNSEHQIMYSYSEGLSFLSPWNGKKPDLMVRVYFKDQPEITKRLEKIKNYSETRGGFIK